MDGVAIIYKYLDAGGFRAYSEVLPEGESPQMPFNIIRLLDGRSPQMIASSSGVNVDRIQVDTYTDNPGELSSAATEVRTLLESKDYVWFDNHFNLPDEEKGLFRRVQEYTVRYGV